MIGNDSDFARFLGVNKSSVSRARKAGRLVLTDDGRVDFEASAIRWHETSGGRTDVAARQAAIRGSVIPNAHRDGKSAAAARADAGVAAPEDPDNGNRVTARTLLLHFENSMIKLEMALRRGDRIDRRAIAREAHGIGAMLRAGIERVIDQTAPRIAATGDELQRRRILNAEIGRLRAVVNREFPRALRRMREAGRKESAE